MTVAEYISYFLKKNSVKSIFMLTGYGAMYLNDAIKKSGIKYYATRNEATAPIMAEAYSRVTGKIGVACVTAGPGATNAIPGLAEAYVDSAPILVISGQVDYKQTTNSTKLKDIRTFGTAEIDIIPIVKPLTKYCKILKNPNDVDYVFNKAIDVATSGRPGPVWIDIPLNVQRSKIDLSKLKKYKKKEKKLIKKEDLNKILKSLYTSKRPLIICGGGIKSSKTFKILKKIINLKNIPTFFSRAALDLCSHDDKFIFGLAGIKGSRYCKKIMMESDLVIGLGCRFSPQLVGHEFDVFKKAKVIAVDITENEMKKKGIKIDIKVNSDLKFFMPLLLQNLKQNKNIKNFKIWNSYCEKIRDQLSINQIIKKKNPIDLYYFMQKIGKLSKRGSILVTDAGSNYYAGGQVWKFNKNQKEIASVTNAAMGLSTPLAIGSAIAAPSKQIIAVTGDGSIELNIQELKTMSHYKLNVKLFVINNGGYLSMHNWADTIFKGRRVDNAEDTGDGTLNFKKIADAFDLIYYKISDYKKIELDFKKIIKIKGPVLIEVMTDNEQKIFDAFKDY